MIGDAHLRARRSGDRCSFGELTCGKRLDERGIRVEALLDGGKLFGVGSVGALRERQLHRGEQAAVHGNKMRREHELAGGKPQDLRDFRRMTMRSHPVGFDAFVRETEMRALGGLLARPGDTRERVCMELTILNNLYAV